MLTYKDMTTELTNQLDINNTLRAALKTIVTVLNGSQPKDIPGAIMIAQSAITRAEKTAWQCREEAARQARIEEAANG